MDWPTRSTNLFIEHFKDPLGKAVDITSTSYQDHPPPQDLKSVLLDERVLLSQVVNDSVRTRCTTCIVVQDDHTLY